MLHILVLRRFASSGTGCLKHELLKALHETPSALTCETYLIASKKSECSNKGMGLPVRLEEVASDKCGYLVFRNALFNVKGEFEKNVSQVHF